MAASTERAPFPTDATEFAADERISYSMKAETHILEAEDGSEWEWSSKHGKWVPAISEEEVAKFQDAYRTQGVDETEPAADAAKKRKAEDRANDRMVETKKTNVEKAPKENTAIYVTGLPDDVTARELNDFFAKFGVIAESLDNDEPRIKLYYDENGKFKGEALIVYFRPQSVQLAISMCDETDFRSLGSVGDMRVTVADQSYKSQKQQPAQSADAKKPGTKRNKDRQKAIKKNEELTSRLADWDDDEPQTLPTVSSRSDKVVVLKNMFTQAEVTEDPSAVSEIKEDIQEECEKFGAVKNVTVFDQEVNGVITVRFTDTTAANACVRGLGGRRFGGRSVVASISTGKEKFKKSKKNDADDDEEEKRLEQFSKDIEGGQA